MRRSQIRRRHITQVLIQHTTTTHRSPPQIIERRFGFHYASLHLPRATNQTVHARCFSYNCNLLLALVLSISNLECHRILVAFILKQSSQCLLIDQSQGEVHTRLIPYMARLMLSQVSFANVGMKGRPLSSETYHSAIISSGRSQMSF